jgi:hypothetical protein
LKRNRGGAVNILSSHEVLEFEKLTLTPVPGWDEREACEIDTR